MRLCDLRDKRIRTLDGKTVGRVHEVHCEKGRIVALMCGPASLIERWTSKSEGHRIAWERVRKVEKDHIVIDEGKPERSASASRGRQGTRRPSGPRSKR
jgi:sporulation protein YlmC with PRC-barrel domain